MQRPLIVAYLLSVSFSGIENETFPSTSFWNDDLMWTNDKVLPIF